jgi:hypothetical protein
MGDDRYSQKLADSYVPNTLLLHVAQQKWQQTEHFTDVPPLRRLNIF